MRGNTTIRGVQRVVLLVVFGLLLGAVLTGIDSELPGSHYLNALTWLGSVSGGLAMPTTLRFTAPPAAAQGLAGGSNLT